MTKLLSSFSLRLPKSEPGTFPDRWVWMVSAAQKSRYYRFLTAYGLMWCLLGNICLNAIRAVATVDFFSCSKSCTCPCEFCLQGQSLIWWYAAKLLASIFSLSEARHHFSSVESAILLTSSDKDTWHSLGCKLAMFSSRESIWGILRGYYGRLPPPESAQFWPLKSWVLR